MTHPATRLMIEKLNVLAALGLSYADAAKEIGASYHYVATFAKRHEIPLRQLKRGRPPGLVAKPGIRSEAMRKLYQSGKTLAEIGQEYGITRERVRQIMTKFYGTRGKDGGSSERGRKRKSARDEKRNARVLKHWGCSYKQYRALVKHPDKPTYSFVMQRSNARARGIGWELSFWQWWKIWEQSGHWHDRGRGHGYGMCRLNDIGPYSIDNVYIATGIENVQDYWVNKRAASSERIAA